MAYQATRKRPARFRAGPASPTENAKARKGESAKGAEGGVRCSVLGVRAENAEARMEESANGAGGSILITNRSVAFRAGTPRCLRAVRRGRYQGAAPVDEAVRIGPIG